MLEQTMTVLTQILIMFLLMAVGYLLYRIHIIDDIGTKQISNLLARVVTPCVIVSSFQREFDRALAHQLLLAIVCGFVTYLIGILLGMIAFRPNKSESYADKRMCTIFSNNGFMALPLLDAMYGSTGIFLGAAHIVTGNILTWSYGVHQITHGKQGASLKNILLNPATVALACGIVVFMSPVKLPTPLYSAVSYLGSLNTPLAMLTLGCYLAQADILSCFRDKALYAVCTCRLVLAPVLCLLFLMVVPLDFTTRMVLLIGVSTPVAVNCAIFAQIFGSNYVFSSRAVAFSTLLSAVTLPLMLAIGQMVLS